MIVFVISFNFDVEICCKQVCACDILLICMIICVISFCQGSEKMDNNAKLRPLYLAKILYEMTDEDHYLTTAQLIDILKEKYGINAHRQTIKTEIELLQKFGIEIQEIKSTQNRYNICSRDFDTSELKLLIDAVQSSKFITSSKGKKLVEKLSALASTFDAENLKRNIYCERRVRNGNEKILIIVDTINTAINIGKQISFTYFQYDINKKKQLRHEGNPYVVTPLNLVWNGDHYYIVAVNDDDKLRTFRVDRIAKQPKILDIDAVLPPDGFDIDNYINSTFRMFNAEHIDVKLLCDNDVIDAIIDRFGEDIEIHKADDNNFFTTVNVATSHIFYSWIFGFCGKVKILEPEFIKDEYALMVRQQLNTN